MLLGLLTHWMEEGTEEDASTNMDHLLQVPDGMASIRDIYAATDPLYLEETIAATSSGARPDPEGRGFAGDEGMKQRLRRAFETGRDKVKGEKEKGGRQ